MDSVGKTLAVSLAIGMFAWQTCLAAESRTIRVSCTIPAIPGVNAALVQQDDQRAAQQTAYAQPKEELDPQEEETQERDESKNEETIESEDKDQTVLVKSLYSR